MRGRAPRPARTFPALGAQVLPDVVVHTHVLLQHVLPGKGLPTLLTGVALHTLQTNVSKFQGCKIRICGSSGKAVMGREGAPTAEARSLLPEDLELAARQGGAVLGADTANRTGEAGT